MYHLGEEKIKEGETMFSSCYYGIFLERMKNPEILLLSKIFLSQPYTMLGRCKMYLMNLSISIYLECYYQPNHLSTCCWTIMSSHSTTSSACCSKSSSSSNLFRFHLCHKYNQWTSCTSLM
jgi:hypothetical protein